MFGEYPRVQNIDWRKYSKKLLSDVPSDEEFFYLNVILQSWTTNCPADFDDQTTFLLLQVI